MKKILMKKTLMEKIKYRIVNIILISSYSFNTHIIYITHTIKLIFKTYKKTNKIFFNKFFFYM